jgi:uncharacterized membrane protein
VKLSLRHRFGPPALAAGATVAALALAAGLRGLDPWLLGWCVHVAAYGWLQYRKLWCADAETMRRRARELAGGRWWMLWLSVLGASAALLAVADDIGAGGGEAGWAHKALTVATVLAAWAYVQLRFAAEYAHEYWTRDEGLDFPGGDGTPEFSEFAYVALHVGCAFQVSDTGTTSPAMRKLVSLHTVVAFLFNAVILAATINLLAGGGGR